MSKNNKKQRKPLSYHITYAYAKRRYKNYELVGFEQNESPCIYVMNHAQMHSPLVCEIHLPSSDIWCTGEVMNKKEFPPYAQKDFWSHKPQCTQWFYKILSHVLAPIASSVISNARTIPVYKDTRLMATFKKSVQSLCAGKNVVIFPEKAEKHNEIINAFHDKFVDLARLYYARAKKPLVFVPIYNAVNLKKLVAGRGITYDNTANADEERKRICDYLLDEITCLAKELPQHVVIPYDNVSKKQYPKSK